MFRHDNIILRGDFNTRTGACKDYANDLDAIPTRLAIDETVNQHRHSLMFTVIMFTVNFTLQ